MITLKTEICNPISQSFYDNTVYSIDLNLVTCHCGHTGCLIWYGSYSRKIRFHDKFFSLRVARVYCNFCHHTHAILLDSIVPYSQIPLPVQADIAIAYSSHSGYLSILSRELHIDENNISAIIRSYRKHWLERLRSFSIAFLPLPDLVCSCFSLFSRPFMQTKTTPNKLFFVPT